MLTKLKNLNKWDKILLSLFVALLISVIVTAAVYRPSPKTSIGNKTPNSQTNNVAAINDDDTSNLADASTTTVATVSPTSTASTSQNSNAQCHINGDLPDINCTPGTADPRVTQDNISQTICVSGYSKSVRPSSSITSKMKLVSMQQYGFTDSPGNYEYDHLISLEIGGAPQDTKNLWPEPGTIPNPKDKVENKLHSLVCNGAMKLSEAQRRIATNWHTALDGYQ